LETLIDDYKVIEKIMTDRRFLSKSSQYSFLHGALGEGLLFSSNEKWFNRRRIITPTFHFKILEQFFEVFNRQNHILMDRIRSQSNGEPFNIFPMITTSVLNSLCETAMGYEMKPEDERYLGAVKQVSHIVATKFLSPWQRIEFLYWLSGQKKKQDQCAKIMRDFTSRIINERRQMLARNSENVEEDPEDDDVGLKKKMCLLDVLLQSTIDNKPLTNADIQEEVDTFTFAGHDTTTNAICFTLYFIAKHRDVQQKLTKEIEDILGDGEITFKSLNEFKYLDLVIKETLRLYPPAPIISRRTFEEVDFDGGFVAPANTNYNMCLYSLFRNPDIFKNPDDFQPERFLQDIPPFAFTPFSAVRKKL
jgi:cytochrome P450 family 4